MVFLGGMLIAGIFYYSLAADENFGAKYRTAFSIAFWVLIPATLLCSVMLWKNPIGEYFEWIIPTERPAAVTTPRRQALHLSKARVFSTHIR